MSNVKFPRKEFEKNIKLTKEVIEKISLFGTPLESVDNNEIEIEVFPNRPDLLSFQGYIRGFKAFLGKDIGLKKYKLNKPEKNFKVKIDSSLKNIRPFTACAIVKNLKFNDEKIKSLIDLQEKLHNTAGRGRKKAAIGVYPLEKIKLPIKFEARKPQKILFRPLEAEREMNGLQIIQRHPTGREYAHLLEGYDKFPVFVDSANKILSMPPIINSHETGKITSKTKEVFVECSGSDLEILKKILNIVVTTLADMGGKIYQMELNYGKKILTPDLTPQKTKVSLENINKLIGLDLKEKDVEKLLAKMGHDYKNKTVFSPAWRTDILHEVDIAEDVAIAYGYDKLVPEIPSVATTGEESKESKLKERIANILAGLQLLEISTYHLIKLSEADKARLNERIELEDSKTDYKLLRPNLLIPALRILSENKDNEYPQKIFEIGTVFSLDKENKTETGIKESTNLGILSAPSNFTELKQTLDYLMRMLDIKYEIEETTKQGFVNGRTAKILLNNKEIGYLGEIHPETLRTWSIKMPASALELSLDEIIGKLK